MTPQSAFSHLLRPCKERLEALSVVYPGGLDPLATATTSPGWGQVMNSPGTERRAEAVARTGEASLPESGSMAAMGKGRMVAKEGRWLGTYDGSWSGLDGRPLSAVCLPSRAPQ